MAAGLGPTWPEAVYQSDGSVLAVQILIVEDVSVLVGGVRLVHRVFLLRLQSQSPGNQAFQVEGVPFAVMFRCIAVVGVLLQIILWREERGQPPKL